MIQWILTGVLMTMALSAQSATPTPSQIGQHNYKEIGAQQLKAWYDQKKPMVVLDARSLGYFDGTLLPSACWLTSEASDQEIEAVIPQKNTLTVVYCSNTHCPAGGWLADRLVSMGYTNVYKYPEGIQDWKHRGYPTTETTF